MISVKHGKYFREGLTKPDIPSMAAKLSIYWKVWVSKPSSNFSIKF